jgi:hypothetical protein
MSVPCFERMHVHEPQKVRLGEQEVKVDCAERKVHTRQLIEAGGLI